MGSWKRYIHVGHRDDKRNGKVRTAEKIARHEWIGGGENGRNTSDRNEKRSSGG